MSTYTKHQKKAYYKRMWIVEKAKMEGMFKEDFVHIKHYYDDFDSWLKWKGVKL